MPGSIIVLSFPDLNCTFGSIPPPRDYEPFEGRNCVFIVFFFNLVSLTSNMWSGVE